MRVREREWEREGVLWSLVVEGWWKGEFKFGVVGIGIGRLGKLCWVVCLCFCFGEIGKFY